MRSKKLLRAIVGLLILQFILGMLANLYSTIPAQKPYDVFHQFGFILFHAINGTLLLVLGVIFLVKNIKTRARFLAIAGLINMMLAYTFGEFFVFTKNNIFSFLMAVAFIGALLSYVQLAFLRDS